MASSESVPGAKRHGPDHRNMSGVCGLLNPVDDQEENDGINSDRRYGSRHPDDRPNNLDLNNWRPCLSSENHHQVKKRNQERELEKRGNSNRRLEPAQDDRNQMQDRDSSRRQAAGAVGGASAANKKTDCNYLVTRLVKLRACLSQALKASEKCSKRVDAKGIQQFDQLSSVVRQLKEEEEFCLTTLQTLLAFRNSESQNHPSTGHRFEEPEDSDAENNEQEQEHDQEPEREQDVNSSVSDNEQMDDAERTRNEVLSFLSQKHEIFYRLLQEQQPSSLSSQEDLNRAEGDLKSCTSWDEGMRRYRPTSQFLNPGLLTRPALSCRSLDGTCVKEEDLSGSAQVKQKYVRNICETKEEKASSDRVNSADRRDHLVVEQLGQQEQHHLEEKLRRLDEKKRNMNEMLQKLQSLRMERSFLNNELASVAGAEVRDLGCDGGGKFSSNQFAGGFVGEAAWSKERHPNHRKLEISNERSDGMQGLYETSEDFLLGAEDRGSVETAAAGVEPDATFELTVVGNDWSGVLNPQCNVYRRENDASATSGNAGKSLNRTGELDAKASPGRSEMKTVKRLEEQKAEDEKCAQLQEKLRQLIGTKETLNNLKQLVTLVRQSPELSSCAADNMLGFPKDLALVTSCSLEEERGEDVVGKFQRQQAELAELMEEHQRLLELQVELERIQETQPKELVDAEERDDAARSSSEVATASQVLDEMAEMRNSTKHRRLPMISLAAKMSSESTQVKFQDPIETVVSNEELYGRMRQQRMLREELLEKKKELQQMMQKDKSLKQNMRNQVTQSDSISYSNRSDQCRASPSEDITTATWGGSTAGNLESMGETENRSCKEDNDNDDDNKDDDDIDDEGKAVESAGFSNNRMVQAEQDEVDEEEYSDDGDDATGQAFEAVGGTNDAIRSQVTKNSSLPNACFHRRFLPLKLSTDGNLKKEAVASGDDAYSGDGTYCIDNDCDTGRIVRPIINSLSVPGMRHMSQNMSQHDAHRHQTASFACNTKEHGLASPRTLGNNRQVMRKNHFSHQRKHQNNVYNKDDDDVTTANGGGGFSALCNEMKLLKSMVSSLIRSLSGKRSLEEDTQVQHNQLFFGLNKCFLQLLSSQNAMAERLNHLEKIVLNNFSTRETITPREQLHAGGQGDSQSPGVKPLPKSFSQGPPCGWKGHFPVAGRKNSLSSESSKVENETFGQPGFRSLQRNKRRSPGQRQPPAPLLHSYPSIVSSVKDGSDLEESVPIKTIHASDMGIPNIGTCAVQVMPRINPSQPGTCFVRKWGDGMNCGDLGRMQPKQNNSSLPHTEKQYRKNLSKRRIWEPRGNNDGDPSTSEFDGHVKAPEFVHVKNRFSNDFVSSGGASSLTAIHQVSADDKTCRAGSAPTQRLPGTSYERSSFNFLQETIYSEVEALVALNEHCPHYLIRLFQELQLLSTDILRQRALLAIQDIVTKGAAVELPEQGNVQADGVSVGCNASEEPERSYVGGLEKTDLKAEFDYAEGVDSGSSLSTPHSTTAMNNNSSLNDTVIQFNNALKWMKAEDDRMEEQDLVVTSDEQFGHSLALELLHLVDDDDDDDDDNESTVDGSHDVEINADSECSSCVATSNQLPNIDQSQDAVQLRIQCDVSSASDVELPDPTGDKSDEDKVAETDGQLNETRVADETAEPGYCAKEKDLAGGQS